MYNSWAMNLLLQFFLADTSGRYDDVWQSHVERTLCLKVVRRPEELTGYRIALRDAYELFRYPSVSYPDALMASQLSVLRALYENYNAGESRDQLGKPVGNMCSSIEGVFGGAGEDSGGGSPEDALRSANYTAIHLRWLEGDPGVHILSNIAEHTGCDPKGALEMEPAYVKSILAPIGMMDRPIVVITDGEQRGALDRLSADPEIGPMLRLVPDDSRWLGGDMTLAALANVFIGNPASTVSAFIARSRMALGADHTYMYRAKTEDGEWFTACGNECLFHYPKRDARTHPGSKGIIPAMVMQTLMKPEGIPRPVWDDMQKQRETSNTRMKLKAMARTSKVYTGLHPDEVRTSTYAASHGATMRHPNEVLDDPSLSNQGN